jgi:hypothetical protein
MPSCCGAKEYYGLNIAAWTPASFMGCINSRIKAVGRFDYGVLILNHRRRGQREQKSGQFTKHTSRRLTALQRFVRENKLGTVTIGKEYRNPNSGNHIFPAVFVPDQVACKRYIRANGGRNGGILL